MKLGVLRRISKEDLARADKELPKFIDALLNPLNEFIEKIGQSLQGRLTFDDNFLCKPMSVELVSGTEKILNPFADGQRNLRVRGVLIVASGGAQIDKHGWSQKDDGSIGVTVDFVSATSATCEMIVLLK